MDPMLGTIYLWPMAFVPVGYAVCNGAPLQIQQNAALFSLIGTRYGGDGINTFNLPDFKNRVPRGLNNVTDPATPNGKDAVTTSASGTASVTLTSANLPAHSHTTPQSTLSISIPVSTDTTSNTETPGPTTVLTKGFITSGVSSVPTKQYTPIAANTTLLPFNVQIQPNNTGSTGNATPLSIPVSVQVNVATIPSYCPVNFIIALVGEYPQRS